MQEPFAARSKPPRMKRKNENKLRVVVVESHQHVLPHVHQTLRRGRRMRPLHRTGEEIDRCSAAAAIFSLPPWTLVHFDSHADLACPMELPARLCWRPYPDSSSVCGGDRGKDVQAGGPDTANSRVGDPIEPEAEEPTLYDLLEATTSGISEWILPLVLGANCVQIEWVRPPPYPPSHVNGQRQSVKRPDEDAFPHQIQTCQASFPVGSHALTVGAWIAPPPTTARSPCPAEPASFLDLQSDARVRVDCHEPYYADDEYDGGGDSGDWEEVDPDCKEEPAERSIASCYAPACELLFPKTVPLSVRTFDARCGDGAGDDCIDKERKPGSGAIHALAEASAAEDGARAGGGPWILDVCLDYFWCDNPFWDDLRQRDEPFSRALSWLVCESILYNNTHHGGGGGQAPSSRPCEDSGGAACPPLHADHTNINMPAEDYFDRRRRVYHFRRLLRRFVRSAAARSISPVRSSSGTPPHSSGVFGACAVSDAIAAASTMAENRVELLSYYPDTLKQLASDSLNLVEERLASISDGESARCKLAEAAIEFVPYLTLPRDEGDDHYDRTTASRLDHLRAYVTGEGGDGPPPLASLPLLVTVARSSRDGFLDAKRADELQQKVLEIVHARYCSCRGRSPPNLHLRSETSRHERRDENDAVDKSYPESECSLEIILEYEQSGDHI